VCGTCRGMRRGGMARNGAPIGGDSDVALLQAFNATAIAETAGCGYVHPGDIPHRLFNGNKLFDPSEVLTPSGRTMPGSPHGSSSGHTP